MGMAASQVRFLSLQNRKNTIGLNLMTLSNRKTSLSRDMNRVAQKYNDAMNQKTLKWSNDSGSTYQSLNYDLMMKQNVNNGSLPYIVSTADGKVVVDNKQLTDSDGNALTNSDGSALTYKKLATMISEYSGTSKNASGLSSVNYSFTDNVSTDGTKGNASKNGFEYIVSSASDGYSYSNSLRYDLFQRLGIISSKEVQSFASINDSIYGNEIGHNMNNYSGLLDQYMTAGLTNTASSKSISLSKTDGSGMTSVDSSVYFGSWNTTSNKITGGSKIGNVALAQKDMQQYKDWCNQPHDMNIADATTFTFTALSGHTLAQTTNSLISSLDAASSSDSSAKTSNFINYTDQNGKTHSRETRGNLSSWSSILDGDVAAIAITGYSDQSTESMLNSIGQTLLNAFTGASTIESTDTIKGWSLVNSDANDQVTVDAKTFEPTVTPGNGATTTDLATAASNWAEQQTLRFYNKTWSNINSAGKAYGGTDSQEDNAANGGDSYNGVSKSKRKYHWYETLANIGLAVLNVGTLGGLSAITGDGYNLTNFNIGYDSDSGYTFNVKDFAKTYLTFYEMYMKVHGDTSKLTPVGSSETVTDDSVGISVSSATLGNSLLTNETYNSVNQMYTATRSDTGAVVTYKAIVGTDDAGNTVTSKARQINKDEYGNTVDSVINSDQSRTVTYTNTSGKVKTSAGSTSYGKIVMSISSAGDPSYSYYTNSTDSSAIPAANLPKKTISSATYTYTDPSTGEQLSVNNKDSKFTTKVSVYLTPSAANLKELQKAIDDANADLAASEASRNNVFSTEESKKMDYYDALFKRISENGWVYDSKVNASSTQDQSKANNYLNAMLENNMYYVTEVDENSSETGSYTYTNKLATNISKIFQVEDTSAENVAESEYETEKTAISNKEEQVDLRMNQLETEQSAITTELDSIKKIINDNVSSTFKIFT